MKIVDDFIDELSMIKIEHHLSSNMFAWYLQKESVSGEEYKLKPEMYAISPVLRHSFWINEQRNSDIIPLIKPILTKMEDLFGEFTMVSCHANLLLPNPSLCGKLTLPHIDTEYSVKTSEEYDTYTALYYVNDSDGDTVMTTRKHVPGSESYRVGVDVENAESVSPKRGRFIYWDSNIFHSAPAGTKNIRMVINFNFMVKKSV